MKIKIDNDKKYIILTEIGDFSNTFIIYFNKINILKTKNKKYDLIGGS